MGKEVKIIYYVAEGEEKYLIDGSEASREEVINVLKSRDVSKLILTLDISYPRHVTEIFSTVYEFKDGKVRIVDEEWNGLVGTKEKVEYELSKDTVLKELDRLVKILEIEPEPDRLYKLNKYIDYITRRSFYYVDIEKVMGEL